MHGSLLWNIKKGTAITNAFEKSFDELNCKPNKIWVDKCTEFYNK